MITCAIWSGRQGLVQLYQLSQTSNSLTRIRCSCCNSKGFALHICIHLGLFLACLSWCRRWQTCWYRTGCGGKKSCFYGQSQSAKTSFLLHSPPLHMPCLCSNSGIRCRLWCQAACWFSRALVLSTKQSFWCPVIMVSSQYCCMSKHTTLRPISAGGLADSMVFNSRTRMFR